VDEAAWVIVALAGMLLAACLLRKACLQKLTLTMHIDYSEMKSNSRRADERTRTAYPCSLRVGLRLSRCVPSRTGA